MLIGFPTIAAGILSVTSAIGPVATTKPFAAIIGKNYCATWNVSSAWKTQYEWSTNSFRQALRSAGECGGQLTRNVMASMPALRRRGSSSVLRRFSAARVNAREFNARPKLSGIEFVHVLLNWPEALLVSLRCCLALVWPQLGAPWFSAGAERRWPQ